jgi:hypothetical protein
MHTLCSRAFLGCTIVLAAVACDAEPPGREVPPTDIAPGTPRAEASGQPATRTEQEPQPPAELPTVVLENIDSPSKWMAIPVYVEGPPNGFLIYGTEGMGYDRVTLGSDGKICVMIELVRGGTVEAIFTPVDQWGREGETVKEIIEQRGETPPTEALAAVEPPVANVARNQRVHVQNWTLKDGDFNAINDGDVRTGFLADYPTSVGQIQIPLKEHVHVTKIRMVSNSRCTDRPPGWFVYLSDHADPPWIHPYIANGQGHPVPAEWRQVWIATEAADEDSTLTLETPMTARWVGLKLPPCKGGGLTFRWNYRVGAAELEVHGYPVTWRAPPPPPPPEDPPVCE